MLTHKKMKITYAWQKKSCSMNLMSVASTCQASCKHVSTGYLHNRCCRLAFKKSWYPQVLQHFVLIWWQVWIVNVCFFLVGTPKNHATPTSNTSFQCSAWGNLHNIRVMLWKHKLKRSVDTLTPKIYSILGFWWFGGKRRQVWETIKDSRSWV